MNGPRLYLAVWNDKTPEVMICRAHHRQTLAHSDMGWHPALRAGGSSCSVDATLGSRDQAGLCQHLRGNHTSTEGMVRLTGTATATCNGILLNRMLDGNCVHGTNSVGDSWGVMGPGRLGRMTGTPGEGQEGPRHGGGVHVARA